MSKAYLKPEAERLYVQEQCSLAEAAARVGVSERTVRTWAGQDDWQRKRLQFLHGQRALDRELYELARSLVRKLREDLEADREPPAARLYATLRLIGALKPAQAYEQTTRQAQPAKAPEQAETPVTKETLLQILSDFVGA